MKTTTFFNTLIALVLMGTAAVHAQYGLGTNNPNAQAALHIEGTNHGILIPDVVLTSATVLFTGVTASAAHNSLLVYNTATSTANGLSGPGFYYWTGGASGSWNRLQSDATGSVPATSLAPGTDGQVLTTTGTGTSISVGWQTPTAATMSHWNVQGGTIAATLNTQDIVQNGDVAVGTATNRKDFSFTGALYGGKIRTHSGKAAITYTDDDFAVVFTKSLNGILELPDATNNNTGRIIALYNRSGTNSTFISRTTPPSGMTLADVVKVTPDGFVRVYAKAAALFISDGSTWYPIGAR